MNDRTMIAAQMMAARVQSVQWAQADRDMLARHVVKDADALLKALAESEAERPKVATDAHDEVGDWREYTDRAYKRHVRRLADGDLAAAKDCFIWAATPQGGDFWVRIDSNNASALTRTRAQDFARRVLEAMEAEGE